MKVIFKHFYILIFWLFLGFAIYIVEEASGLSGGFFGKHFISNMYFLALVAYAAVTTVVVAAVAVVKHRKQQTFSTGSLVVNHILTVIITIAVAYVANSAWDIVKHRQFNKHQRIAKELANTHCPDIDSWQWIQVSNELALTKFALVAKATTSISLDQFSGYKAGHFFQLHQQFRKPVWSIAQGKTYTLLAVVATNTAETPYANDNFSLRMTCGDYYMVFSPSQNQSPADPGYLNNQPIVARQLVPAQELVPSDEHANLATLLLKQNQSARLNTDIPMSPKVSIKSIDATRSDVKRIEKHGLPPSPSRSKLTPNNGPTTLNKASANTPKIPTEECNSALMKCQ